MEFKPTPQQAHAVDDGGHNIIVSAGAGSGKTTVLTQRVLRLIKNKTHVNELLVLTFTNAAAAEMKSRIRDVVAAEPSLKNELNLVDQSYITTFDSYALSIVKKYHYLLNISNNITISESSIIDLEKVKILDKVFAEYYEKKNKGQKQQEAIPEEKEEKKFIPFGGVGFLIDNVNIEGLHVNKDLKKSINTQFPTCHFNIRLFNGEIITCEFNYTHTLRDIYIYVKKISGSNNFILLEGFPPKPLNQLNKTIQELKLDNTTLTQKIK